MFLSLTFFDFFMQTLHSTETIIFDLVAHKNIKVPFCKIEEIIITALAIPKSAQSAKFMFFTVA